MTALNIEYDEPLLGPVTRSGRFVRLEPLRPEHLDGLLAAAQDDRIWPWLSHSLRSADAMRGFIEQAIAQEKLGGEYAFAVIKQPSGRIVGSTRYMDVTPAHRGVEIGWTWYTPDVWATAVNPATKLLLMEHAFETWGAIRVYLKTDELNERSRGAILKLGARFEGILRNHRIRPDGSFRGSAVYSVVGSEWPGVKAGLLARLAKSRKR
jgi:RimJ/RimL family protein N-acetyltransferase